MSTRAIFLSDAARYGVLVPQGSTVGSIQVADLLEALRRLGADPAALCAGVGLSEAALQDSTSRVPASTLLVLLTDAGRQLGDPLIGLHAGARVETRGPLFYLLLSSPRVSDGLQAFARFARVPLDTQQLEVSVDKGIVTLNVEITDPVIEQNDQAIDYILGANLSSLRRAIPSFQLLGVELAHEEKGEPGATEKSFGCPVRFGCRHNRLRFPDSLLGGMPAAASPAIAEQIEKFATALLSRISAASATDRVADAVRTLLGRGAAADRPTVAKLLAVSERTLQRQLEQESVTFSSIRDTVRAEISQALLSNRGLTVEAIAASIGFAEPASFSKAFTRWSGCSPRRYRDQLGARPRI